MGHEEPGGPVYDGELTENAQRAPMKAVHHTLALAVKSLAVAIPFLFAYTRSPMTNFWPLIASAMCGWLIVVLCITRVDRPAALRQELAQCLRWGLILAGALASVVGLIQFFLGDVGMSPWIYPSALGQAIGNLRQRNQQATLILMSALALLLWLPALLAPQEHERRHRYEGLRSAAVVLLPWVLALLAMGSGATASRTGAVEWVALVLLLWLWRASVGKLALAMGVAGLLAYLLAAWALPELLLRWTGVQMDGLFMRVADTSHRCTSRLTLWSNMLYLIELKPWLGWGWGELDYAHYSTIFPGERFCLLLDNAHNLPLHLAVELGVPVAIGFCALVAWATWRGKPWRETEPARQLAWGVLAFIGMHSMLEFPLWYGPFQLAVVLAVTILLLPRRDVQVRLQTVLRVRVFLLAACCAWLAGVFIVSHDFLRMSQLYVEPPQRIAKWRDLTAREVSESPDFFTDQAEFAWLTTASINERNAVQMHAMARRMLHYSPEPRVITKLIESAQLLGFQAEVDEQLELLRIAYPDAYAHFKARRDGAASAASTALAASAASADVRRP
ncbi:Wzy polymerase domain-containing protein [Diaphorobacter ruginosibacter]|uniref:PglL family O-oligosaccharyltransferase n=1 Tax=Diaphorobacter ruginosibacter TaxID=1715720 RepID=UPI003342DD0C